MKLRKKLGSVLLSFCLLISMVAMSSVSAWAATTDIPKSVTVIAYPEHEYQFFARSDVKASSLKSSDRSVVSIKQEKGDYGLYYFYLKAQKPGSASVSVKIAGKTYKSKVTVTKYVNPVKSVKVGSTSVSGSKFNSSSTVYLSYGKFANKKLKTTVELKKGWKLDSFYIFDAASSKGESVPGFEYFLKGKSEGIAVKNGGKVPVKGGKGFNILISAINQKSGVTEYLSVTFK